MRPPSAREAKGYDVVVWVDDDGDIVSRGFTKAGHEALKKFVNEYRSGDIVQIYCSPHQFALGISPELSVGLLNSQTGKIMTMRPTRLQ